MSQNEVTLKIEHFYNDEDIEFRIRSKREMLSILQNIADQGTRVALFYGSGKNFILTTLIAVNEHGMWLDVGPFPPENKQILLSDKITFVSSHQHVKVQFVVHDIQNDLFENNESFYMDLPEFLLRIQRREFFRTPIPSLPVVSSLFSRKIRMTRLSCERFHSLISAVAGLAFNAVNMRPRWFRARFSLIAKFLYRKSAL